MIFLTCGTKPFVPPSLTPEKIVKYETFLLEDTSFDNLEEEFKRMEQRGMNISYHQN